MIQILVCFFKYTDNDDLCLQMAKIKVSPFKSLIRRILENFSLQMHKRRKSSSTQYYHKAGEEHFLLLLFGSE